MPFRPVRARLQATLACAVSLLLWQHTRTGWAGAFALALSVLAAIAWISPSAYTPVDRALQRFASAVARAITWVVLALVYFGVFTPLRWWRSIRGIDPLALRRDPAANTFLSPCRAPSSFERQF